MESQRETRDERELSVSTQMMKAYVRVSEKERETDREKREREFVLLILESSL